MQLAHTEVEQWLATVAAEADRAAGRARGHTSATGCRVDSVSESEIESAFGSGAERRRPRQPGHYAQEQFFKKLLDKAKKVVKGAVKLAKKGIKAVGKLLPTGKIFAALRKLVSQRCSSAGAGQGDRQAARAAASRGPGAWPAS